MYVLVGRMIFQTSGCHDHGPYFRSGDCFSGLWFEVELLFLDFSANSTATNRYGRRLESLESEHRPDSPLYPAMILLNITLFKYLQDRTRTRRGNVPTSFSLATARCEAA